MTIFPLGFATLNSCVCKWQMPTYTHAGCTQLNSLPVKKIKNRKNFQKKKGGKPFLTASSCLSTINPDAVEPMQRQTNSTIHERVQQWVEQYGDDLYRWALSKTSDRAVAEDLVQETFLAAFKNIGQFQGRSQPKTWLFSIMRNKTMDYHRKAFREVKISAKPGEWNPLEQEDPHFDRQGNWKRVSNPDLWSELESNLLDDDAFQAALKSCLDDLPRQWRQALQLKFFAGKTGKEICNELGVTQANFWQITRRAKVQLRECLEKSWFKAN